MQNKEKITGSKKGEVYKCITNCSGVFTEENYYLTRVDDTEGVRVVVDDMDVENGWHLENFKKIPTQIVTSNTEGIYMAVNDTKYTTKGETYTVDKVGKL